MGDASPEIHGGVGAPGTPGLGAGFESANVVVLHVDGRESAEKAEVSGGEGVGLAEGAHGDVLGGPLADAGDFAEAAEK